MTSCGSMTSITGITGGEATASLMAQRRNDCIGRRYAAAVSAVGGREIVDHAGLAGEKQPIADRRRKDAAAVRVARHGMRVGAARVGIAPPGGRGNRM